MADKVKKALIWKAFTTEDCEAKFAKCLYCDKMVSRGSEIARFQNTTNLKNHMKKDHPSEWNTLQEMKASENKGYLWFLILKFRLFGI